MNVRRSEEIRVFHGWCPVRLIFGSVESTIQTVTIRVDSALVRRLVFDRLPSVLQAEPSRQ